jgi:type 1 fimbriae regulatory protein FimB
MSSVQLRAWLRERNQRQDARSSYLFLSERGPMTRQAVNYLVKECGLRAKLRFHVHPHMLRHSTGYYLANRGYDTRLIQDYLGHKNIMHTVRYTRTAAFALKDCGGSGTGSADQGKEQTAIYHCVC